MIARHHVTTREPSVPVPNFIWYAGISDSRGKSIRCPYATVEACPRYYQSLALLGEAGSTKIPFEEDKRLLAIWKTSDLWPRTAEQQATTILGPAGDPFIFSRFCPEVLFDRFGYFVTDLVRYTDELDRAHVHTILTQGQAARDDPHWIWQSAKPQHYTECPIYSVLSHRPPFAGRVSTVKGQSEGASPAQPDKPPTRFDSYTAKLKNHPVVAVLLVFVAIVGGIAQFTDAVSKVTTPILNLLHPAKELPALPGGSGWILLGDLDQKGEHYIRGPFYKVEKSSYPDQSLIPRKGEQVLLTAERNVVIAGFKTTGLKQLHVPPWTVNVLTDADYTGIKLSKDSVVEVRDVSLGSFPDQPLVVWIRIAPSPR